MIKPAHVESPERTYSAAWLSFRWSDLATGDVGEAQAYPTFRNRSVQAFGTFGPGGRCLIEGSNDGQHFDVLHDVHGVPLTFAGSGIRQVCELPRYVRPRVEGGDATTRLSVAMLGRHDDTPSATLSTPTR